LGAHKNNNTRLSVSTKMRDGMMQPTTLSNSYCKKTFSTRRKIWNSSNEGDWRHDNWHTNSNSTNNRVIQTQHQKNHQFWWYLNWVSSPLSFFLSASTAATYIFTARTCTTTIISLEPCALNAKFQHFILRFNKMSLLCGYHWKRG
jgi:hypothetical protein